MWPSMLSIMAPIWGVCAIYTLRGAVLYIRSARASDRIVSTVHAIPHGFSWTAFSHIDRDRRVGELRLLVFALLFAPIRCVLFMIWFLIFAMFAMILPRVDVPKFAHVFTKVLLMIFGLKLECVGDQNFSAPIVVSNHVGMIDVVILLSRESLCFLADNAIRSFYIFGVLWGYCAERIGCLFVSREDAVSRSNVIRVIHDRIKAGPACERIAIFPEGTTSNGTGILPFKLGAAFECRVPVQPVVLEYTRKEWGYCSVWSDVYFAYILALPVSTVKLTWLPVEYPSESESVEIFANRVRTNMLSGKTLFDYSNHKQSARTHNHMSKILARKSSFEYG